jgi:hypothetical protein
MKSKLDSVIRKMKLGEWSFKMLTSFGFASQMPMPRPSVERLETQVIV